MGVDGMDFQDGGIEMKEHTWTAVHRVVRHGKIRYDNGA